jgi:hypothetical protein
MEKLLHDRALDAMEPILDTVRLLLQLLNSRLEFGCPIFGSPQLQRILVSGLARPVDLRLGGFNCLVKQRDDSSSRTLDSILFALRRALHVRPLQLGRTLVHDVPQEELSLRQTTIATELRQLDASKGDRREFFVWCCKVATSF